MLLIERTVTEILHKNVPILFIIWIRKTDTQI